MQTDSSVWSLCQLSDLWFEVSARIVLAVMKKQTQETEVTVDSIDKPTWTM
jgi:hypothetical protein